MPPVSTFATPWSMNSWSRSSVAGAPATPRTPRCIMSCSRVVSRVVPYFATPTAFFFWRCTGTRSPAVAPFPAARWRSSNADDAGGERLAGTPGGAGARAPGGRRGRPRGPASSCDSAPAGGPRTMSERTPSSSRSGRSRRSSGPLAPYPGDVARGRAPHRLRAVVQHDVPPPPAVHPVEPEPPDPPRDRRRPCPASSGMRLGKLHMKLTQPRSSTTMIVSPVSSAPRPSDPSGQCSTHAPSKWPPMRATVTPGTGSTSSSNSSMRGERRGIHRSSARGRNTGASNAVGELEVRGVEVRVRQADRARPRRARRSRWRPRLVEQRDAVPQHVARRRPHEQGALADPELAG